VGGQGEGIRRAQVAPAAVGLPTPVVVVVQHVLQVILRDGLRVFALVAAGATLGRAAGQRVAPGIEDRGRGTFRAVHGAAPACRAGGQM